MLALHQRRAAARTPHEQGVLAAQIAATDRQMALCALPAGVCVVWAECEGGADRGGRVKWCVDDMGGAR